MHGRQRAAQLITMLWHDTAQDRLPRQKGCDQGRAARQVAQRHAIARGHRLRAGNALARQMLHERDEERQLLHFGALFIEREDIGPGFCLDAVIAVFGTFIDADKAREGRQVKIAPERVQLCC